MPGRNDGNAVTAETVERGFGALSRFAVTQGDEARREAL
jgi:hypothetical protein